MIGVHLTRWVALGAAALSCACTRSTPRSEASADDDAAPITVTHETKPAGDRWILVGKDVVDLESRRVVGTIDHRAMRAVIHGNQAFVDGGPATITAIDLPGGETRWTYKDPNPKLLACTTVVDERRLYAECAGAVYAFDRSTGQRSVMVPPKPGPTTCAFIGRVGRSLTVQPCGLGPVDLAFIDVDDGGTKVISSDATTLYKQLFATETAAYVTSEKPATSPPSMEVSARDDRGGKIWVTPLPLRSAGIAGSTEHFLALTYDATPRSFVLARADGKVVSEHKGKLWAISETDAGELDGIYIPNVSAATSVDAYDPKTDARRWTVTLPCKAFGSADLVAHGDRVVVVGMSPANGGCVVGVDRKTGSPRWTAEIPKLGSKPGDGATNLRQKMMVRGDEIVVVATGMTVEALEVYDASTGELRFEHAVTGLPNLF